MSYVVMPLLTSRARFMFHDFIQPGAQNVTRHDMYVCICVTHTHTHGGNMCTIVVVACDRTNAQCALPTQEKGTVTHTYEFTIVQADINIPFICVRTSTDDVRWIYCFYFCNDVARNPATRASADTTEICEHHFLAIVQRVSTLCGTVLELCIFPRKSS